MVGHLYVSFGNHCGNRGLTFVTNAGKCCLEGLYDHDIGRVTPESRAWLSLQIVGALFTMRQVSDVVSVMNTAFAECCWEFSLLRYRPGSHYVGTSRKLARLFIKLHLLGLHACCAFAFSDSGFMIPAILALID